MSRWVWLLIPVGLLALCWWTRPFAHEVASIHIATRHLSPAQVQNLKRASHYLHETVLLPGESFSFNRTVGPRSAERGYVSAPSYLEGDSPSTLGGGVCLLSSALYQAALKAGLPVNERVPHLRTIRSVPPGLDATVWYGQADLKFTNATQGPLRLEARMQPDALRLSLQSSVPLTAHVIRRLEKRLNAREVQVTVLRDETQVSRDLYRLP